MDVGVTDEHFVSLSVKGKKEETPRNFWPAAAVCAFAGSLILFAIGLGFSALVAIRIIAASRAAAYATVGLLLAGFASAFLGAHALDSNRARGQM